jgi:hypothetical protein
MPAHSPSFENMKRSSQSLADLSAPAPVLTEEQKKEAAKKEAEQKELDIKQREKEIKEKNKALEARKSQKDGVIKAIAHQASNDGGAIGKAEHLAGLTAEGVAGEMLADLFILSVELTFNTPVWVQMWQFNKAIEQELASIKNGDPVRLAYMPNEDGDYPEIYPIDGKGKVDYSKAPMRTYNDDGSLSEHITPFHIRANGYVPRPSITESLMIVLDRHFERMLGSGVLSPEQKARMSGTVSAMQAEEKQGKDLAADRAAQILAAGASKPTPTPTPRPGGGH